MRRLPAILIAALPLAACGGGGGNESAAVGNRSGQPAPGEVRDGARSDGAFDRADYRRTTLASCARSQDFPDNPVPPEARDNYCTCVVDHLLLANDDQLRAMRSDRPYQQRAHRIVVQACTPVMFGRPPGPMVAPPDEAAGAPAPEPR
jgi:hypothetical protein